MNRRDDDNSRKSWVLIALITVICLYLVFARPDLLGIGLAALITPIIIGALAFSNINNPFRDGGKSDHGSRDQGQSPSQPVRRVEGGGGHPETQTHHQTDRRRHSGHLGWGLRSVDFV